MTKKQYKPQSPVLPTDTQTLEGSQLPIHGQVPKGTQEYPTSGVKRATIDGENYYHCPYCAKYIKGNPTVINSDNEPKITNKSGPAIYYCLECGKVLATVGNSTYNTGIGQNANPSSNTGRVAPRS